MAGTFPVLSKGTSVMYPLKVNHKLSCKVLKFMDNSEQRWQTALPLVHHTIQLNNISTRDASEVRDFFRAQFGRYDSWSLVYGGKTYNNMMFDQDELPIVENSPNRHSITMKVVQVISDDPIITAMTARYPQINSNGIITGLPYTQTPMFWTVSDDAEDGQRYTYRRLNNALGRFEINYPVITPTEADKVKDFFYAMYGRYKEFVFIDPGGNLAAYSDDFSHASWAKVGLTVGGSAADPWGGTKARSVAASSADAYIQTDVLASSINHIGLVMTASVWVKPSANMELQIGLTNYIGWYKFTRWSIKSGVWTRIYHSAPCNNDSATVAMVIGGGGSWTNQTIAMVGAQTVAAPGPGGRILTPGWEGLHMHCRFDTDELEITHNEFNSTSINVPIVEIP